MNQDFQPDYSNQQSAQPVINGAPVFENKPEENVGAGIVGAFLFSLAGAVLWFILYQVGFLAGISGYVAVICAIKGYSVFSKGESFKGVIISVVIAVLVIILAWYSCLAYDIYLVYGEWFAAGEIDFEITIFEAFSGAYLYLTDPEVGIYYWKDLIIGILLCAVACFSTVKNAAKKAKQANQPLQ